MKKILLTFLFALFFLPAVSYAADIFFSSEKNNFSTNEEFLLQVYVDTKDTSINALEGKVAFPPKSLELKEVRDGNSAINFWVDKPHLIKDGEISFSGITTGGFSGDKKFLFSLVLEAQNIGDGRVTLENVQILQNDGLGTNASVHSFPFSFSISDQNNNSEPSDLTVVDTTPPESFVPYVASDTSVFNGGKFVVFSTVDKGSGIDHYEVKERPWYFFGLFGGSYVYSESPYLLQGQSLKDTIYVKAVDNAGNERVFKVGAKNKLAMLEQFAILGIILAICILSFRKILLRRTGH